MLELVGKLEPARVIRVRVKVCQHLIHAAELGRQHLLNLIVAEIGENAVCPCGEFDLDIECLLVSGEMVCIAQPGKELVLDIPRRPQAVQVEASGADLTLAQIFKTNLAGNAFSVQLRADVAIALRFLNLSQLLHHLVGALFEAHVAGGRIHHADRGKIMARNVSSELPPSTVPPAVSFRRRLETGAFAEIRKHAGRLKLQQILCIEILRLLQRATRQPHGVHWQRNGLELNLVRSICSMGQWRCQKKRAENKGRDTGISHAASRLGIDEYKIVYGCLYFENPEAL